MAKYKLTEDNPGSSSGSQAGWAKQTPYRDGSGRTLNTAGDYRPQSEVNPIGGLDRTVGTSVGGRHK